MKKEYSQLLALVNGAIRQKQPNIDSPIEWNIVLPLINKSGLKGVILPAVKDLLDEYRPENTILNEWRQSVKVALFRQSIAQRELGLVFKEAQKRNLHLVSFKGIMLSALYPDPVLRFSSDADIYVDKTERVAAEKMLWDIGYYKIESSSKEHVPVYRIEKPQRCLKIELHDCLWEDYEGYQTKILDSLNLMDSNSLIQSKPLGYTVTTMNSENHLIFLAFHLAKHFALEAINLRFLTDIMLFIERFRAEIDWNHFWAVMGDLKYDILLSTLLNFCHTYFEFDNEIVPDRFRNLTASDLLIEDILQRGTTVKESSAAPFTSQGYIESYFMREKKVPSTKKLMKFFPPAKELKKKYAYAKKYPILLPFAWIHRFINVVSYAKSCRKDGFTISEVMDKAEFRVRLIKEMGLTEEK